MNIGVRTSGLGVRSAQLGEYNREQHGRARGETPGNDAVEAIGGQRGRQQKDAGTDGIAHYQSYAHPEAEQVRMLGGHLTDRIAAIVIALAERIKTPGKRSRRSTP